MTDEPLWTSEEVAEFLRVKRETIRDWARDGKIPAIKLQVGRRADWRFVPDKIRNYVEKQSQA